MVDQVFEFKGVQVRVVKDNEYRIGCDTCVADNNMEGMCEQLDKASGCNCADDGIHYVTIPEQPVVEAPVSGKREVFVHPLTLDENNANSIYALWVFNGKTYRPMTPKTGRRLSELEYNAIFLWLLNYKQLLQRIEALGIEWCQGDIDTWNDLGVRLTEQLNYNSVEVEFTYMGGFGYIQDIALA